MTVGCPPVVLVVDDDAAVRGVLVGMAHRLGYDPVAADGGEDAVALLAIHLGDVAAVLLDVEMPGLDGPASLAALRALAPGLPCVFVTGYSPRHAAGDLAGLGATVLAKPVRLADLGRALDDATGRTPFGLLGVSG
jgi:CheY-like chemotaxis protein